jgi:hypothetical protein
MAISNETIKALQLPEGYTVRKIKGALKVVAAPKQVKKVAIVTTPKEMVCSNKPKEKKMTKILIETGSESHTSSSLSVQAKFVGGAMDGKPMYQAKNLIVNTKWYPRTRHESYCENIWELQDGTRFEIICKREDGVWYHNVYEVDSSQEITDTQFDCGKRKIDFKGRVRLIKDVLAAKEAAAKAARTEGF